MMGHAWLKHREALLALVIILMIGAIGSRAPSFVSPGNLVEMFNDTAILIILALRADDGVAHQRHRSVDGRQPGADRDDRRPA